MNEIYYELPDYGDDFLMHHGIKGQKWGIRRTAQQLGHFTKRVYKTGKEAYGKASTKIKAFREKRIEKAKEKAILKADYNAIMKYKEHMTDEEFKHALSRMDTNKKIQDLATARAGAVIEHGVKTIETIARVGLAVNQIRKTSADIRKTRAEASAARAKATKQTLENQEKRREADPTYVPLREQARHTARAAARTSARAARMAGRFGMDRINDADERMYRHIRRRMGGS